MQLYLDLGHDLENLGDFFGAMYLFFLQLCFFVFMYLVQCPGAFALGIAEPFVYSQGLLYRGRVAFARL